MKKSVVKRFLGRSFWITFIVHGFFVCCFLFVKPEVKKPVSFVVRNVKPQMEKVKIAIERPKSLPIVASKPAVKAVKKIAPQKQKSKEMLKKIVKQLDKVEKLQTIEKKIELQPEPVFSKEIPPEVSVLEPASHLEEALMQLFWEKLCLPQKGKVRIKLCISGEGRLLFTEILENQNDFNLSYLQEILPQLSYPERKGEKSYSYDICFEGCDF